jgi:medium-chain acyl-[acyl-carrier-protein] hydrolase
VLPGLRADFGLAETYTYARPHKLTVPASVYYGEHDEIEEFQIRAWQEQLAAPACFERIAGGHFFIHTHLEQLTDLVGGKLMALDCGSMRAAAVGC